MSASDPPLTSAVEALRGLLAAGRFRELLAAWEALPAVEQARAEVQLLAATAATRLSEYERALEVAGQAAAAFRARADADGQMRTANLLGAIRWERGELRLAETHFEEALRLAQATGDSLMWARASNNLASVAHLSDRADEATARYREALLAYQRLGDRRGIAETWHNLGLCFRWARDWHEAETASQQALRNAELVGERTLRSLALSGRAELHLDSGDLPLALREALQAGALAREAGDEVSAAEAERLQAQVAYREGNYAAAATLATHAHEVATRDGVALMAAESAALLALVARRQGNTAAADGWRAEALATFAQLGAAAFSARFEQEWARAA